MNYKMVFKDIMRTYEVDRDRAAARLRHRREEVYGKVPRIREIDRELALAGISAARQIAAGGGNVQTLLDELRKRCAALKKEKKRLLSKIDKSDVYFTDIYKCGICQDTGHIGIGGERCQCLNQRLIDKYYDLSNIRYIVNEENFTTFDFGYFSETVDKALGVSPRQNMERVYKSTREFIEEFGSVFQNLLFYGSTGLGKTFLCNCIAKELLDNGKSVLYVTTPRIIKMVEDYRFNRNEVEESRYTIDAVTDVDLLILDDLGSEFGTVVTSAALFDIINERLLAEKPTVISTNLTLPELEKQYSDRIVSRFLGNYIMFKFVGDDIRAKKKYGG